jgi:hypothetical protein
VSHGRILLITISFPSYDIPVNLWIHLKIGNVGKEPSDWFMMMFSQKSVKWLPIAIRRHMTE